MKTLLKLILILSFGNGVFAESGLVLTLPTGGEVTNSSITVFGSPSQDMFEVDVFVKNTSDTTVKLRVRRKEINVDPLTTNYFCWYQCYSPMVSVDPPGNFFLLATNESNTENFHAYYKPQGFSGISTIRYTFFNNILGHENDSAFVEITFNTILPTQPILLQIPQSGFVTNSYATANAQIDTIATFNDDIIYPLSITNNTNVIKKILVKKREINVVQGSENLFAWSATFNPNIMADTMGFLMYPHSSISNAFKAIYNPNNNVGESEIQYVFYNKYDVNDSSYINIKFNVVYNSVQEDNNKNISFDMYPNPASNFVNFAYKIKHESNLIIQNLLGQTIAKYRLANSENNFKIETSNLQNGIYFCSIINSNGKVETNKLVISK